MTDRELLELAARAASVDLGPWNDGIEPYSSGEGFILSTNAIWNPRTNDGDALRLAVKLRITVEQCLLETKVSAYVRVRSERQHFTSVSGNVTREQATRDAITRAAAEIGKAMP